MGKRENKFVLSIIKQNFIETYICLHFYKKWSKVKKKKKISS